MSVASRFSPMRAMSVALLIMAAGAFLDSLAWRGARFPGFFIMPNRVVPSAGLPDWSGVAEGRPLYQQVLLAVNAMPVSSGQDAYRRIAAHRGDDPARYLFANADRTEERSFPVRQFTDAEYVAIFGMYFINGLAYLALAVVAGERWREGGMFRGLAAFGWVGAAFAFSGMDLYGPGRIFRLHVAAEALLPAAAAHLALVCPRDRAIGRPGLLPLVYGVGLALAAVYELLLYDPRAYSIAHNACQGLVGIPAIALVTTLGLSLGDRDGDVAPAVKRWLFIGALAGIIVPAIVLALSGISGGGVPVNATAWVGFAFPSFAIAALRRRARG
jgi:hypothetical protein